MVEFISKRRYVNFEGCKFHLFTYRSDDEYKINKLRTGRLYGKDYMEIGSGDNAKEYINKTVGDLNIIELEKLLADKRAEEGFVPTPVVEEEPAKEPRPGKELPNTTQDQFETMINALDHDELKEMCKEKANNSGVKFALNQSKETLREFLKEE